MDKGMPRKAGSHAMAGAASGKTGLRRFALTRGPLRQRGQAIIYLLGTLAASAAVLYGVYNVGQLQSAKAKTVNAADAAALAGATVEARMLNLVAYNNRSMIANEVMLIQMLSIEAWLGYVKTLASNSGALLTAASFFFPPIEIVASVVNEAASIAQQVRDDAVKPANSAIIAALEVVKGGLAVAHQAVVLGGGVAAEDAATHVVQANNSNFGVHHDAGVSIDNRPAVRAATFALNEERWIRFSKRYSGDDRTDARQVLLDSRDDFSTDRPGQFWGHLTIPPGLSGIEKRGGSKLEGFDHWETEDTVEIWVWPRKPRDYLPIGWGRANADSRGNSGDTWSPNHAAQSLARSDGVNHSHSGWSGVPAVFDIADKATANRANLGIDFLVVVARAQDATPTTSNMAMGAAIVAPTGSSDMQERLEGNRLSAIGKARVSFERPQRNAADRTASTLWRNDSAKEYGSLFSPYWQARLADLTAVEKTGLMTAMGIDPLLAPCTPGAKVPVPCAKP